MANIRPWGNPGGRGDQPRSAKGGRCCLHILLSETAKQPRSLMQCMPQSCLPISLVSLELFTPPCGTTTRPTKTKTNTHTHTHTYLHLAPNKQANKHAAQETHPECEGGWSFLKDVISPLKFPLRNRGGLGPIQTSFSLQVWRCKRVFCTEALCFVENNGFQGQCSLKVLLVLHVPFAPCLFSSFFLDSQRSWLIFVALFLLCKDPCLLFGFDLVLICLIGFLY